MYPLLAQLTVANPAWLTLVRMWEALLANLPNIFLGIIIFTIFKFGSDLSQGLMDTAARRTGLQPGLALLFGRLASTAITILGILLAAIVIFPEFKLGDLISGLGISTVAIGFAFKDILQNFFAGILILWRQPFLVGDQIRVQDYEGTVVEINLRSTRLKTYSGEQAVLPNGDVYTSAILVRTAYDQRRICFNVGIGYLDSLEEARAVIHQVLADTQGVLSEPSPWVYVCELAASSVNFNVYFWTASNQANVLAVSDQVATGIKLALDAAGIDMPYPHSVVLFHDQTGAHRDENARVSNSNDGIVKNNKLGRTK